MIDVGGPAMLRAAAKSFASVTRGLSPAGLRAGALGAVGGAGHHDARAAPPPGRGRVRADGGLRLGDRALVPAGRDPSRETFVPAFDRVLELSYGENPHQAAAYYAERGARTHLLSYVEQHQGKPLSFNNLNDLSAARLLAAELNGLRA